ncbi:CBM35 domain-containing protein [Longispora sp. NPDC051575]|uniref:fibronectin type III domain-containing protein n=1 Tax=Longispora sp. NPDC051575 TaxID=3154943 RepID=UPI003434C534
MTAGTLPVAQAAASPVTAAPAPAPAVSAVAQKPYLGWSSWSLQSTSYPGVNTRGNYSWLTEANVMAQANAMVSTGLRDVGYQYVNMDSGWFADWNWNFKVDAYGRPTQDTVRFPTPMGTVISRIHALGLKAGLYYPAGMMVGGYDANAPVFGSTTGCTTRKAVLKDANGNPVPIRNQWNGWYVLDFSPSNPCGQEYISSVAQMFSDWGVDHLKIDGVTPGSTNDSPAPLAHSSYYEVAAWRTAFAALHWQGEIQLSYSLPISYAEHWKANAESVRIDNDVECYCGTLVGGWSGSLTQRWRTVVPWLQHARPGFWPNLDSLDVGNGAMDGLTDIERQSYMTLWSIVSAPLYIGDDLTRLDSYGLSLLKNTEVIAQNQSGLPARPVNQDTGRQVWTVRNADGTYTVALFNLDGSAADVTADWSDLGLPATQRAAVRDMWSRTDLAPATGRFTANLPAHGSRLIRINPGPPPVGPEAPGNVRGYAPSPTSVTLSWTEPKDNTVPPSSVTSYDVYRGTVRAATVAGTTATITGLSAATAYTFTVVAHDAAGHTGPPSNPVSVTTLNADGSATYKADDPGNTLAGGAKVQACTGCTDGNVVGYLGGGGTLTFNNVGAVAPGAHQIRVVYVNGEAARTADVSVNGGTPATATFPGTGDWNTPRTLTLTANLAAGANTVRFANPGGWAPDIDSITVLPSGPVPGDFALTLATASGSTPGAGTLSTTVVTQTTAGSPQNIALTASGAPPGVTLALNPTTVTSGGNATLTITVTAAAAAGTYPVTVTGAGASGSHAATYSLTVAPSGGTTTYQASEAGILAGGAVVQTCPACSNGRKVGYIGYDGTLTIPVDSVPISGNYTLRIAYVNGGSGRSATITVNGTATSRSFGGTNDDNWNVVQTLTVTVALAAGGNTIRFGNPNGWAPDIATITV